MPSFGPPSFFFQDGFLLVNLRAFNLPIQGVTIVEHKLIITGSLRREMEKDTLVCFGSPNTQLLLISRRDRLRKTNIHDIEC